MLEKGKPAQFGAYTRLKKPYVMGAMRTVFWVNLAAVFGFSSHYFRAYTINIMRKVLHIFKLVFATNTLFYTTVNFKSFRLLDFSIQLRVV